MRRPSLQMLLTVLAVIVALTLAGIGQAALRTDGGESVQVKVEASDTQEVLLGQEAALSEGGAGSVRVGSVPGRTTTTKTGGDPLCATNSSPDQGFTDKTMKWGTIIPLTGALRPLGEQTARVMKIATERWLNSIPNIPGPYSSVKWGCGSRPGVFGRQISLQIFSLQANTPEEAFAGMRRLIDVEKVFLVRDCYLESNLLGPANQYQNQKGVPGIWCSYSELPLPRLAPWNFSPGVDPLKVTGVHIGALINPPKELRAMGGIPRQRLALIADPTLKDREVAVARKIAANLGRPIPDGCVVLNKGQDAPNGMDSQIAQIRGCYPPPGPDAIVAFDVFNAAFGAMEARDQGWRGATVGVQWSCLTCWVQAIAELCADACENMITDCQALPCIPWADRNLYPAAAVLSDVRKQYLPGEPDDILTHGPAAITGGLGLWLGMTGPDISRDKLRNMFETQMRGWDAGIGPILTITPDDHYGGKSVWLMKFTGSASTPVPWFGDITTRFVPLSEVGVSESLTKTD